MNRINKYELKNNIKNIVDNYKNTLRYEQSIHRAFNHHEIRGMLEEVKYQILDMIDRNKLKADF